MPAPIQIAIAIRPDLLHRLDVIVLPVPQIEIDALFRRIPILCGFALEEDLQPTEVSVHTWPGYGPGEDLYEDILTTLVDLVEERPDAAELLRGRTFARHLQ